MSHSNANGTIASGRAGRSTVNRAPLKTEKEFPPIEGRNWLIHTHYTRKEFDVCRLIIDEELQKSNGFNEYANYVLGLIFRHEGKIQESMEQFQKCHTLNPKNLENIKQVARSLFLLGRHELAIEAYLEAEHISETPDWNIYYNLGKCYMQTEKLSKAREYLKRAVQLGKVAESYTALGELYVEEDEIQNAIDVFNAAVELFPDESNMATTLGLLYMKTGEYHKAFINFGIALAHDPTCANALVATGVMIQKYGEYDTALSKYKLAAQFWPESSILWNNVAMCFFGKKKYIAAISCLKRANYLNPLDWKTLYNLGLLHVSTKQYASAFVFLSTCVKLKHKHAQTFMLLGITLQHLDDTINASKAFEQAIKLDPDEPGIRINYGSLLYSHGNRTYAVEQLNYFNQLAQHIPKLDPELLKSAKSLTDLLTQDVVRPSLNKEIAHAERNIVSENENLVTEEQSDLTPHGMMNDEV